MKKNVYEIITDRFLEQLKNGDVPWRRPWKMLGDGPMNIKTKKPYNGINILLLLMQQYPRNFWASYKQWGSLGAHVRKGEEGTPIIFWKWIINKKTEEEFPILRYWKVFNIDQVEDLDEKYVPSKEKLPEFKPIEKASKVMLNMPNKPLIEHTGDRACYSPIEDRVRLPIAEAFETPENYYATAFHELVHSTGHSSRLNRKGITDLNMFGSHEYSKEELVAELGSSFLCAECNILNQVFDNSSAYINNWISHLEKNPKWIVSASSKAEKATNYILGRKNEPI